MALAATVQWDVRTSGSDSNGGGFDPSVASPGTDYSQQNSAQVAFTDLVIGATNTQLTSAAHPFTSAHAGNIINVVSGTGFTVGRYEVLSVSGVTATMDRAVGTAASTAGVGNLGGSLATPGAAAGSMAAGNKVNIKTGTYTVASTISINVANTTFVGFATTHGDGGSPPTLTTSTNSSGIFVYNGTNTDVQTLDNLILTCTAGTPGSGIFQISVDATAQYSIIRNCKFSGWSIAVDFQGAAGHFRTGFLAVTNCEFANNVQAMKSQQISVFLEGCYIHGGTAVYGALQSTTSNNVICASRCIISTHTQNGFGSSGLAFFDHCVFYNITGFAIGGSQLTTMYNCIFYGNGAPIDNPDNNGRPAGALASRNNAFGSNGAGPHPWPGSPGDVTLTANPFTNSSGGDFSLNSTSGGGAACQGTGFPGAFPGGTTSPGHPDIGAVQGYGAAGAISNYGWTA